ncbi:type I methionyl aminopeptidase [Microbacterium sp. Marseille-Q6965]|uniref:type I methionyl aminopeptidase n=1 Tax=Microbacterium sp. Marseille-Q6965 TaxID=2965072 RepID=UPI0021B738AE|nr:type I methionyl aminopeptidase [Microbacterium sp. Marseille-Q6965]
MFRRSAYKTPAQLRAMVAPGLITHAALEAVRAAIRPGMTTLELDAIAEAAIVERGAHSNFQLVPGYHHTICVSVNDEVVHGIPGDRVLEPGDIVSVDCGAETPDGWNGDSAITIVLPDAERPELVARREELSEVTRSSMWAGIAALATARHLGEVGASIEEHIEANPLASGAPAGILRDYVGHGIGRSMHEPPTLFNYRTPQAGARVKPGLAICVEPMMTSGSEAVFVEDDEWTVTTEDGSDGAHWEHSVAVHDGGVWVLTAPDGGAEGLAPFGVTPTPLA